MYSNERNDTIDPEISGCFVHNPCQKIYKPMLINNQFLISMKLFVVNEKGLLTGSSVADMDCGTAVIYGHYKLH